MMPVTAAFLVLGAFAGATHAGLVARAAKGFSGPWGLLLRLALVAVVLLVAARAGVLLTTAVGWFGGFLAAGAWFHHRLGVRRRP